MSSAGDGVERRIVLLDLTVALTQVSLGVLLDGTVAFAADQWWVAPAVAAATSLLTYASDRSESGKRAMIGVGTAGILAVIWAFATDALVTGVVALAILGIGVGIGLNRVVFGVVRAIPEPRLAREG